MIIASIGRTCVAFLMFSVSAANAGYVLTDLGMPQAGFFATALAINSNGQVAGYATTPQGSAAFLYSNGSLISLGTLPGDVGSVAKSINDKGDIVGYSWSANYATYRPFLYSQGVMIDLSQATGQPAFANAISNTEQVAGNAGNIAFLYESGTSESLGVLGMTADGQSWSYAYGINNLGQVVGSSSTLNGERAYIYANKVMTSLGDGSNGFSATHAIAINDTGEIVGYGSGPDGVRAFVYSNGVVTTLGTYKGDPYGYYALDINNAGQIVGHGNLSSLGNRAFLFQDDEAVDLFALVENGEGWTDNTATGINDQGQISGYGMYGGLKRAFILNPASDLNSIPEPSTLPLVLSALFGWRIYTRGRSK